MILPKPLINIPRSKMPQIESKHLSDFLNNHCGGNFISIKVDPRKLKAIQGEFNKDKIQTMMDDQSQLSNPIITCKGGYVLDGNHRWLACLNLEIPVNCQALQTNLKDSLDLMNSYRHTFNKALHECLG